MPDPRRPRRDRAVNRAQLGIISVCYSQTEILEREGARGARTRRKGAARAPLTDLGFAQCSLRRSWAPRTSA